MRRSAEDPSWTLVQRGYGRAHELGVESRFAVGNGALVRGSLECPTEVSSPSTYVAGLYDLSATEPVVPTAGVRAGLAPH